jgi:hypothetical protein
MNKGIRDYLLIGFGLLGFFLIFPWIIGLIIKSAELSCKFFGG